MPENDQKAIISAQYVSEGQEGMSNKACLKTVVKDK